MSQRPPKPLTKSRFKTGYQCPTKLYYLARPNEYANNKDDDEFLKALAEGGYQVGELAMLYYENGTKITTLDYDEAIRQTDELLEQENVTIFEPAFRYGDLFIRVDILVKRGRQIELTEVKAKSFNSENPFDVFSKRELKKGQYRLKSDWGEYILDLAFQTHVLRSAKPDFQVSPGLMLADQAKCATVDGLNQLFLIKRVSDKQIEIVKTKENITRESLGEQLLTRRPLTQEIDLVIEKALIPGTSSFLDLVEQLGKIQKSGARLSPNVGAKCKNCEFRIKKEVAGSALKSGFEECWKIAKNLNDQDFSRQFVFDVWNFRGSQDAIEANRIFASDLCEEDLEVGARKDELLGYSSSERQWIQVQYAKGSIAEDALISTRDLNAELRSLKPPYHFIDFETAMVAIPFHKGRKPYEQMAYQFSHHTVDEHGEIIGYQAYLDRRRGKFPNFDFVRALKNSLSHDEGVVFRFAAHENTVLNQIHQQLEESSEADRDELMAWIETLATPPNSHPNAWEPTRQFVDMRDLTLRHYYLPDTKGSNSIKKLLPAVLNRVGVELAKKWPAEIKFDAAGKVIDPYKSLPPIFGDVPEDLLAKMEGRLVDREDLNDGGAAMLAWARMQFTEMSDLERNALAEALLRYCKLDTLAMVMIWEWWRIEIKKVTQQAA